jgi:hypothetical protein
MYEVYRQHRAKGASPRTATQLTGKLYGKRDAEELRHLQVTLEALELRDEPRDPDRPVQVPTGPADFYLAERRAGVTHADARERTGHAYGRRGDDLDVAIARALRDFEREVAATTQQEAA